MHRGTVSLVPMAWEVAVRVAEVLAEVAVSAEEAMVVVARAPTGLSL